MQIKDYQNSDSRSKLKTIKTQIFFYQNGKLYFCVPIMEFSDKKQCLYP